jgi:hypothetical protein
MGSNIAEEMLKGSYPGWVVGIHKAGELVDCPLRILTSALVGIADAREVVRLRLGRDASRTSLRMTKGWKAVGFVV